MKSKLNFWTKIEDFKLCGFCKCSRKSEVIHNKRYKIEKMPKVDAFLLLHLFPSHNLGHYAKKNRTKNESQI